MTREDQHPAPRQTHQPIEEDQHSQYGTDGTQRHAPLSDEARAALDRLSAIMQDAVARIAEKKRQAAQQKNGDDHQHDSATPRSV